MSGSLTIIDVHFSLVEAHVARSMLEAHGILAWSATEFVAIQPHLMIAHGGLPLSVPASQADDARALLDIVKSADPIAPPPRRRVLEGLAGGFICLGWGVPPGSSPAQGHSMLRRTGPLALALGALSLLQLFLSDGIYIIAMMAAHLLAR